MQLKKIIALGLLTSCCRPGFIHAQPSAPSTSSAGKPALDTNALASDFAPSWPQVTCKVSNDGRYAFSYPVGDPSSPFPPLLVEDLRSGKRTTIENINIQPAPVFTTDNQDLIFIQGKDSLCSLHLSTGARKYVQNIQTFSIAGNTAAEWLVWQTAPPGNELHITNLHSGKTTVLPGISSFEIKDSHKTAWLLYRKTAAEDQLHLHDLETGKQYDFPDLASYKFSPDQRVLLIKQKSGRLLWVNLLTGITQPIYSGSGMDQCVFDKTSHQLAFTDTASVIWYYREGMKEAAALLTENALHQMAPGRITFLDFNREGSQLLLSSVTHTAKEEAPANSAYVRVWNYRDGRLPLDRSRSGQYWLSLDLDTKKAIKLCSPGQGLWRRDEFDHYLMVSTERPMDDYYNPAKDPDACIIDVRTGAQNLVGRRSSGNRIFSPQEKYIVWFDGDSLSWFSYETSTGITRSITKTIPVPLYDDYPIKIGRPAAWTTYGLAGWSPDDTRVYMYDKYDIWEVDPLGQQAPVCITKSWGRKEKVTLSLNFSSIQETQIIKPGETLVLSAYDTYSKNAGFWTVKNGSGKDPVKGAMLPYAFDECRRNRLDDNVKPPHGELARVGNTGSYLVTRQSAEEYPNYFLTSDFIHYRQLTDLQPQSRYNWLTAELVHWQLPDGEESTGILYKPENFDPTKKYPLIFDYYQGRSNEFHLFRLPIWSNARIDIPYYVSNGYLVFIPDIFNKKGANSQQVVDVVTSAARYLGQRPYINAKKLGIQGHSVGGWETNVLVTHTQNVFAAACSAGSLSDMISWYDEMPHGGAANQPYLECNGQLSPYGVGVTPWTNLRVYADDSPILFADKVTTPLLIIHGDKDQASPYPQGLEFYLALKRAGKKTWLLEYPEDDHCLNTENSKDYTIRMKQFFDYYLKDAPPPKWMTKPIDAAGRQENTGYALDQPDAQP